MRTPAHIPVSTYRLQFNSDLRLAAAQALVPYLAALGIGDAYASPLFRAREHSSHGYDVVDHHTIDPELGNETDFQAFAEELSRHRMGLMMDVVPNHMGIDDPHNVWWQDVLENGTNSQYARFFDVDWQPPKAALKHKVLIPILGEQYGRVLENQELQLLYENQSFRVAYFDRRFPLAPSSWADVLRLVIEQVQGALEPDHPDRMELESIVTALENLPTQPGQDAELVLHLYREKEVARRRLTTILETSNCIRQALDRALIEFNGQRGSPHTFDRLEELLAKQHYRLAYWRVATDEINYRRFFDINELAAIRVEDPEVFEAVHSLVFRFIERGWVTALRIDHPDGLLDPQQYFTNLQETYQKLQRTAAGEDAATRPSLYIAIEKILGHDESLPAEWPVSGTTGYDFLNLLNGLLVNRQGAIALRSNYAEITGQTKRFLDVLYESKKTILNVSMSSELHVLAWQLDRISEQHRWSRDFTQTSLRRALREVIAFFPVYRSYIRPGAKQVGEEDRHRIVIAVRIAKRRNPEMSSTFFDFIESVLLLDDPDGLSEEEIQARRQFVLKFQQVTGPVTAKGVEDTAFYRSYPLASLNEVGGDPSTLGESIEQFHRRNQERLAAWPYSMLATATHDTKRGEDMRARLDVLSEAPDEWHAAVLRWQVLNEKHRLELDGAVVPDANEEYLLYQTLVGAWPVAEVSVAPQPEFVERIVQYMIKSIKEAKLHSSWLNPYLDYDEAIISFVRAILDPSHDRFLAEVGNFATSISNAGYLNSLTQTVLKICAPGVPDFYQGTELWDFNLVDPDNRRSVDFALRQQLLSDLQSRAEKNLPSLARDVLTGWTDPRVKLLLVWRALTFRRQHADLFLRGNYVPLAIEGPREAHACAFGREREGRWALVIAPRFTLPAWREHEQAAVVDGLRPAEMPAWRLSEWWRGTTVRLPLEVSTEWRHVISEQWVSAARTDGPDRLLDLAEVFGSFPVGMLEG